MAITEWRSPSANSIKTDRTPSITGITDAYSQNGSSAYCAGITKDSATHPDVYLFNDFGFSLPAGVIITRVHIEVDGYYVETAASLADVYVQFLYVLRKSAAAGYSAYTFIEALSTANDSTYQLLDNAATPLMGYASITPEEVNSTEFGVSVEFFVSNPVTGTATINLDHIRMAIEYRDPLIDVVVTNPDTKTGTLTDGFTYYYQFAPSDIAQSQTIDVVTLTQQSLLVVNNIAQAQSIDNCTLTQAHVIAVAEVGQSQLIDDVTLTLAGSLALQSILQVNSLDNVTLTQQNVLAVLDLVQAQAIDSVTLTQQNVLSVSDLLQAHAIDAITLSTAGGSVMLQDITQGQAIDTTALVQHSVIAVNDLTQAQIIDIVTLGGLVIGELKGTPVIYALLGGEITILPLLDGVVAAHP